MDSHDRDTDTELSDATSSVFENMPQETNQSEELDLNGVILLCFHLYVEKSKKSKLIRRLFLSSNR